MGTTHHATATGGAVDIRSGQAYNALRHRLKDGLDGIYFIHGAEPLLVEETLDLIRRAARFHGIEERLRLTVEPGFDWSTLTQAGQSMSLFASRRLIELRMPNGKPGDKGARALAGYSASESDDVLAIASGRLDRAQQSSKWFKQLSANAVVVETPVINADALPAWIASRARDEGIAMDTAAANRLSDLVEGNLLAADQEIRKLKLLCQNGTVGADEIQRLVADHARFSVFALVDAALSGDAGRCLRVLSGIRREGAEPVTVLWAISREVRVLERIAGRIEGGASAVEAMRQERVWSSRQKLTDSALQRLPGARPWRRILAQLARCDRLARGRGESRDVKDPWFHIENNLLHICGINI